MQLVIIKRRADFLRVRGGPRWSTVSFALEARMREAVVDVAGPPATEAARFGFTVTKKLGNAVVRNRVKRRLREAVRLSASPYACAEYDYVVFARDGALRRRFADLQNDVVVALQRVHAKGKARSADMGGSIPDYAIGPNGPETTGGAKHLANIRKPRTPAAD